MFEHYTEFCCPLLVQRDSGESMSLAEVLQEAMAIFTVYNRDRHEGKQSKDSNSIHYWLTLIDLAMFVSNHCNITVLHYHCSIRNIESHNV